MRRLESSVPHRLGRRTNFIPAVQGSPAKWADVMYAAADPDRAAALARKATATVLTPDPEGHPLVQTADPGTLAHLEPDQLFAVRRPASHTGMTNYISRVGVPSALHDSRAVWCESFNELSHLRDLLLTTRPRQVSTQPFRLEWVFPSGVRSHVPDFMLRYANGRTLLVDVTTTGKLDDPRLTAILRLTRATAEAMAWTYEIRTELPSQRVRNINFIYACRHDVHQDRSSTVRALRQAHGPVDIQRAAGLLGEGPHAYARLWDLIAHGHVFVPLDDVIDLDTPLTLTPRTEAGAS